MAVGLAASLGSVPLAQAQSVDIPLQLQEAYYGARLVINVGIDGQAPRPYMFDTGSDVFVAAYTGGAFGSIPSNMSAPTAQYPNGLPTGVYTSYTGGDVYRGNIVAVPSLTFYPTSTVVGSPGSVTLNATTPAGQPSSFLVDAVYNRNYINNLGVRVSGPTSQTLPYDQYGPSGFGGNYGIFGVGNFTSQFTGSNPGQAGVTPNTSTATVGGVLGQSVLPGVTAGYVVAANGQALSGVGPTPFIGATVNGPQVGQSVSSCSPCVMLGLTPALLAQFKPINTIPTIPDPGKNTSFSNSGTPSSIIYGTPLNYTLNSPGYKPVNIQGEPSLLDTGTPFESFEDTTVNPSFTINSDTKATISGPNAGATPTTETLYPLSASNYYQSPYTGTFTASSNGNIIGIGFFLQNSVLFNLAGQAVGYTPNFVTDTAITTTSAAPLTIDGTSVPLGLAGVISGTGGIAINAGGSATLSGTNTYTGATSVNGGMLALAGPGSIAASSGVNVTANGLFDISETTQGTTIVTLAGDSTGSVTLGGQTLTLANAASTFGGVASGTGGLTLLAGTQVLTGANIYTGTTTVNGGTLEVDGSLASSNVAVNAGGTLSGIGTIGDPVIGAGGTLAPGTATTPGQLTINGPLSFAAGSNYNVRVAPTVNDSTAVNGAVTIAGGTVNVIAANTSFPLSSRFDILTATGGIQGAFSGTTSNLAFLTPLLSQDASNIYLTVLTTAATAAGTPDYRSAAVTRNQLAVATALTTAGLGTPNAPLLAALNGTTLAQAQGVFDSLSGEGISGADTSALMQSQMFSSALADQGTLWLNGGVGANAIVLTAPPAGALAYAPLATSPIVVHGPVAPVRTWRAWASGFGADATLHGLGQTTGLGAAAETDTIYGGAAGLDYQVDPTLLLGIAGGGSSGSFNVAGRATSGQVTGGHVGAYGVATSGAFYGLSTVSGSFFRDTENRLVPGFGGLAGGSEQGGTDARVVRARVEVGRRFAALSDTTVTPFVALEIADLHTGGFTETSPSGAGAFALSVAAHDTASVPTYVGLRLEQTYVLANGMGLRPVVSIAYGHDFAPARDITNALVALPNVPFEVAGAPLARNFVETKLGAELAFAANAALFVDFDGDFSGREQVYGGKGGIKVSW